MSEICHANDKFSFEHISQFRGFGCLFLSRWRRLLKVFQTVRKFSRCLNSCTTCDQFSMISKFGTRFANSNVKNILITWNTIFIKKTGVRSWSLQQSWWALFGYLKRLQPRSLRFSKTVLFLKPNNLFERNLWSKSSCFLGSVFLWIIKKWVFFVF